MGISPCGIGIGIGIIGRGILYNSDILFSKTASDLALLGIRLIQIADSLSSDGNLRSSILWLDSAEKRAATVIPSPCTGYSAASDSTSKDQSLI